MTLRICSPWSLGLFELLLAREVLALFFLGITVQPFSAVTKRIQLSGALSSQPRCVLITQAGGTGIH